MGKCLKDTLRCHYNIHQCSLPSAKNRQASLMEVSEILTFPDNAKWKISSLIPRSFRKSVSLTAISMALVACRLYRLKTITCAKYPRQGTPLQSTPVQSNDYQNQNLVSLAIHYRRALAVRLQYATMHKDLKRNLSSALPDFFRFENVFIMTKDSFVCKKKLYTTKYVQNFHQ